MGTIVKQMIVLLLHRRCYPLYKRAFYSRRKRALDERENSAERRFTIIAFFSGAIRHEETAFSRASGALRKANERSVCIPFPSEAHLLPQRPSTFSGVRPLLLHSLSCREEEKTRDLLTAVIYSGSWRTATRSSASRREYTFKVNADYPFDG